MSPLDSRAFCDNVLQNHVGRRARYCGSNGQIGQIAAIQVNKLVGEVVARFRENLLRRPARVRCAREPALLDPSLFGLILLSLDRLLSFDFLSRSARSNRGRVGICLFRQFRLAQLLGIGSFFLLGLKLGELRFELLDQFVLI